MGADNNNPCEVFMWTVLLFLACATPEAETTPFEGPGFDESTDQPLIAQDSYVLAITELHVINAPKPGNAFGEHADAVGTHLYSGQTEIPGFVGGSFRNVGKLQWWTLTVWTDEPSMLAFVTSEPHVNAMADLSAVAKSARSTHLTITKDQVPVEWDFALEQIDDVDWMIGDGS